jgi:hypothetical protein
MAKTSSGGLNTFFPITLPSRWDWGCGRDYDLILRMVEIRGCGKKRRCWDFLQKKNFPV